MTSPGSGERAIVTGAAAGIGRATALRFGQNGARVCLVDVNSNGLDAVAAEVDACGGESLSVVADVRDEAQIAAAIGMAVTRWGGLDIVVANAGVLLATRDDRADRLALDAWQQTLDVNLTGVFLTCKHGIAALLATGGGAVVCTASPTGLYGCAPGLDAYSASKAGVCGLVRVMAADFAADGIRVNGVIPGHVLSPMTEFIADDERSRIVATIPCGRPGLPDEIAAVIVFLASPAASYVHGALWAVDGGMTAI